MLSYQHAYHAGNHADVFKHAVLTLLLASLARKEKPFTYIDTHSGRGIYDLDSELAQKTGEAAAGIIKVLEGPISPPESIAPYLDLCRRMYSEEGRYPGSPALAVALSRPGDSMHLMELHPGEIKYLRRSLEDEPGAHVHFRDGFSGITALTPPKPRRGMVLIDPSYETADDYALVETSLTTLCARWPEGIICVWYPLVRRREAPTARLKAHALTLPASSLYAEFCPEGPSGDFGLYGSELLILNPPWKIDEGITELGPWLTDTLGSTTDTSFQVQWLIQAK